MSCKKRDHLLQPVGGLQLPVVTCGPCLEPSSSPVSQTPSRLCPAPLFLTVHFVSTPPPWPLLSLHGLCSGSSGSSAEATTVLFSCLLGPACVGGPLTALLPLRLHLATGHADGCHCRLPDLCLIHAFGLHGFAALGPGAGPPAPHGHRQCVDIQQLRQKPLDPGMEGVAQGWVIC